MPRLSFLQAGLRGAVAERFAQSPHLRSAFRVRPDLLEPLALRRTKAPTKAPCSVCQGAMLL